MVRSQLRADFAATRATIAFESHAPVNVRQPGNGARPAVAVRLMLINYEYPPLGGGAGNATACIARALARQQHDVTVLTSGYGTMHGSAAEAGVRTVRLRTRRRR